METRILVENYLALRLAALMPSRSRPFSDSCPPVTLGRVQSRVAAGGADQAITRAIDTHVQAEQANDDDSDGSAGVLAPMR
jgi:hypothetical protein